MRLSAPMPRYRKVKEHVLLRIRSGEWPAGYRIPSENRLVEEMGISRMTVNRALRELASEGILDRLQGVGTFVSNGVHRTSLLELRNIADEIAARGHVHASEVVVRRTVVASRDLVGRFEDESLEEFFHLILVHSENGVPVQIENRHVNPRVAPDLMRQDLGRLTPTEYLLGLTPVCELEHLVRAVLPNEREQSLLRIAALEPCLVVHRRSWSLGRVATIVALTYPSSRYELGGRHRTSPTGTLGEGTREGLGGH